MAKKNSQFSDDEIYETTEQTVDSSTPDTSVTPDATETPVTDEKSVTPDSEAPVVENPTPDATETPVNDQNPTDETPVTDEKSVTPDTTETPVTPVDEVTDGDKDPVDDEKPSDKDKEPVKINEFKRFDIRFGYSIDSRSTTARRTLSTTEIVKQFVKAPTCFIAFESKEDLKDFETLLKAKTIKVEDKDGKLVDFSDAAKKHLVTRVTELSTYWIARNSK